VTTRAKSSPRVLSKRKVCVSFGRGPSSGRNSIFTLSPNPMKPVITILSTTAAVAVSAFVIHAFAESRTLVADTNASPWRSTPRPCRGAACGTSCAGAPTSARAFAGSQRWPGMKRARSRDAGKVRADRWRRVSKVD